ncbi:MAG: hypothetical protein Q9204_003425 [Flavoplaca sp. TL-2023a]
MAENDRPGLRDITNQQHRRVRRTAHQHASSHRSENVPFRSPASRNRPYPSHLPPNLPSSTASSSTQQPPRVEPVDPPPSEATHNYLDIRLRIPQVYPPVEKNVDLFVPFHFTWTSVRRISDNNDPMVEVLRVVEEDIEPAFSSFEPPIQMMITYGRVNEVDEFECNRAERDELEALLPYDVRHPKVFAFSAEPNYLHRHWQAVDPIVRSVLKSRLGRQVPLSVRYYYGHWAAPLNPSSSSLPIAPHLQPITHPLPVIETTLESRLKPPTGQPRLIKTSIRDPWPNSESLNMGYTVGRKDAVRGLHPNGTLGLYVRLRAANGKLLPWIFGLTNHHVFSNLVGDKLVAPPLNAIDPSPDSRAEIVHPPIRDFQNSQKTFEERGTVLEVETAMFNHDLEHHRVLQDDIRWQTMAWIEQEQKNDNAALESHQTYGQNVIGTLWASSGREIKNVLSHFNPDKGPHDLWLADWALVKMSVDCKGQNIVSVLPIKSVEHCLIYSGKLPPASTWPRDHPADFDILRAHGGVFKCAQVSQGELVMFKGRTGMQFGRVLYHRPHANIMYGTHPGGTSTAIGKTFEAAIIGIEDYVPFAWNGDSGSAILNRDGHVVGILHAGQTAEHQRRIVYFTPIYDVFDDIKRDTGCTVELPEVHLPRPTSTTTTADVVLSSHPENSAQKGGKGKAKGKEKAKANQKGKGNGKGKETEASSPESQGMVERDVKENVSFRRKDQRVKSERGFGYASSTAWTGSSPSSTESPPEPIVSSPELWSKTPLSPTVARSLAPERRTILQTLTHRASRLLSTQPRAMQLSSTPGIQPPTPEIVASPSTLRKLTHRASMLLRLPRRPQEGSTVSGVPSTRTRSRRPTIPRDWLQ